MKPLTNNLKQLSCSGFLTPNQFNFNTKYITKKNQQVYVRYSSRLESKTPTYNYTRKYTQKNKKYYCEKCDSIKTIKYCRYCRNKLEEEKESDFAKDIYISEESEVESVNSNSTYESMSDGFVVRNINNDDDYELPSEEVALTEALKKQGFKYILKQNCSVVNNNNIISSDEELMMDDSSDSEKSKCYI
jgi:membrane-associated HD superfamily phosphohydrolase